MVMEAFGKVWTWITGIFGWSKDDEIDQDKDGEKMSLSGLALKAVGAVWAWIKKKFTFDIPGFDLPSIPNLKDMIYNFIGGVIIINGFHKKITTMQFQIQVLKLILREEWKVLIQSMLS